MCLVYVWNLRVQHSFASWEPQGVHRIYTSPSGSYVPNVKLEANKVVNISDADKVKN